MEYSYKARDKQGSLVSGTVQAAGTLNAHEILQNHGLIVVKLDARRSINIFDRITIFDRVSTKEVVLFSRQLSTLVNAKVPIIQSLKILQYQVSSYKLRSIITEIMEKVENGESLSSAITEYPVVFSDLYVNLVKSGELSGSLDDSLEYLANQLEKDYDLRSKVVGAMTYPAFIICVLILVGLLMFLFVLPPLVQVLTEAEVELPITTKVLIATTGFVQAAWVYLIIALVGGVVGLRFYINTISGRYLFDLFKIRIPMIGSLFVRIYMARFSRNLATLAAGGIPIVKSLESVADIIGNKVYKEDLLNAADQVKNGKSIATSILENPHFPPIVSQMVQIGESTGKLQEILEKLASFYEKEIEGILRNITSLIEPIIMILLGLAVAVMVSGVLLPMYNLAGAG